MAVQTAILNQYILDTLDGILDHMDDGGGPGYVEFWEGTIPATLADATTGTLLVTIVCDDPAWAAAVDTNPGGSKTLNPTAGPVNAVADGQIDYYRAFDSAGNPVIQGNAGLASAACIVSVADTTTGFPVDIISWIVTMQEANY